MTLSNINENFHQKLQEEIPVTRYRVASPSLFLYHDTPSSYANMTKTLILLSGALLLASCNQGRESAQETSTPKAEVKKMNIPMFDGDKAFAQLKAQTDFGPRNPNSLGHAKCLSFLVGEFAKYAENVTRQDFVHKGYDGEMLKLTNVFASFNAAASDRILFLAHWDTRPRADQEKDPAKQRQPVLGANDGASGVAVLLEMARLLKAAPPSVGIDILLVDGEDYGKEHDLDSYFLGARYFMKTKSQNYSPRFAVLLDMVGDRDLQFPMEQNSMNYAPQIVELIWSTAEKLGVTQFVNVPGEQISDDHIPLNEGGIPAVDIIDFQYAHWHTLQDTPDKCSGESLEAVGKVMTHLIYSQGSAPH